MEINWNQLDERWREKWHESKDFETNPNEKPKKFITVAYPSFSQQESQITEGQTQ